MKEKSFPRPQHISVSLYQEVSDAFGPWWDENKLAYPLYGDKMTAYIAFRDGYIAGKATTQDDGK